MNNKAIINLERELNEARKTIELKDAAISLLQIGKYGTVRFSDQFNEANADRLRLREALRQCKADADALAEAVEYTIKADAILHPATDHVGMRQALETYRSKYQEGKQ